MNSLDAYRARTLIRVGTCGGLSDKVGLRSLVISQAAGSDSTINRQLFQPFDYAPCADFALLCVAAERARQSGVDCISSGARCRATCSTIPTK